jgi:hypothetical protein
LVVVFDLGITRVERAYIVNVDFVVVGADGELGAVGGVGGDFDPFLGVGEDLDDVVEVLDASSDVDFTVVDTDGDVAVLGVDADGSGTLVGWENAQS